jgi:hypothetical protein
VILLNALANAIIGIGWSVTKIRMGAEWAILAYKVGRDTARGVVDDSS